MRATRAPRVDRDRGAVLVEMALVLPILLMLLIGVIEFGLAYNTQVRIQGAAREGARAAALGDDAGSAVGKSLGGDHAFSYSVSTSGCPANAPSTSTAFASVTVTTDFTFSIPFVDLGTKTLTATAQMRCGL